MILVGPIGKPSELRQVFLCIYVLFKRFAFSPLPVTIFPALFRRGGLSFALSHLFHKGLWPSSTILMVGSLGLKGFKPADSENLLSQVFWPLLLCYEPHGKSSSDSPSPMKCRRNRRFFARTSRRMSLENQGDFSVGGPDCWFLVSCPMNRIWPTFPLNFFMKFSQKMPLNVFYTTVQ